MEKWTKGEFLHADNLKRKLKMGVQQGGRPHPGDNAGELVLGESAAYLEYN